MRISRTGLSDRLHQSAFGSARNCGAAETKDTKFPEYDSTGESGTASRVDFVPPPQEVANAIMDAVVDRPVREHGGPIAEVVRPASQTLIEAVSDFRPRVLVARIEKISHFLPQA